jgi:uncharacterized protein with PQ loop repeat
MDVSEAQAWADATATISLILWTVQLLPQIYLTYCRKSTDGISSTMLWIWYASAPIAAPYVLFKNYSIALVLQPHMFGVLMTICILQDVIYGGGIRHRFTRKSAKPAVVEVAKNPTKNVRAIEQDDVQMDIEMATVDAKSIETLSDDAVVDLDAPPVVKTCTPVVVQDALAVALFILTTWAIVEVGLLLLMRSLY